MVEYGDRTAIALISIPIDVLFLFLSEFVALGLYSEYELCSCLLLKAFQLCVYLIHFL